MAFGLSSTGFLRKRLADISGDDGTSGIKGALRDSFGQGINLRPQSVEGQLVGIFSEAMAELWELAEDVYDSQSPDKAEGAPLDDVVALTGQKRQPAVASRVVEQLLFGTSGTAVPAGTVFSVVGNPLARFATDADVTLGVGQDEVQTLTFAPVPTSGTFKLLYGADETAAIAWNATGAQVAAAINALPNRGGITATGTVNGGLVTVTYAGPDGKQNHPLLVVSANTLAAPGAVVITPATTTDGSAQATVGVTAEATGPTLAPAYALTVIETPVAGLASVRNREDADIGRDQETDLELRQRRQETVQVAGAATVEAIRARLLELDAVTDVIVFENDTLVDDVDGRPGKCFEAVVNGGDAQEIVDTIWLSKAAGISTFGNQSGTTVDSQGFTQDINWSRPTEVDIYVTVDAQTSLDIPVPVNAAALIKDAIVARGNELGISVDVVAFPRLICALDQFPWIVDGDLKIGTAPAPTSNNPIAIAPNEISRFDTTRVVVNLT